MGLRNRENVKGGCYFVTISVVGFVPIFKIHDCAQIVIDSLNYSMNKYCSDLLAYVLMPHHLHCILWIPEKMAISNLMRDFKKFTSVQIKHYLENAPEHQAVLESLRNYVPLKPNRSFKLWQDRFDDLVLRNEATHQIKIKYIYYNPVRAGLVSKPEDYPYSSFYEKSKFE